MQNSVSLSPCFKCSVATPVEWLCLGQHRSCFCFPCTFGWTALAQSLSSSNEQPSLSILPLATQQGTGGPLRACLVT